MVFTAQYDNWSQIICEMTKIPKSLPTWPIKWQTHSNFATAVFLVTSNNRYSQHPEKSIIEDDAFSNNTYYKDANCGVCSTLGMPGKIFWGIYIPEQKSPVYYPDAWEEHKTKQQEIHDIIQKFGHLSVTP